MRSSSTMRTHRRLLACGFILLFVFCHLGPRSLCVRGCRDSLQVRNLAKQFSTTLKEGRQDWSDIQQTFDKLHDAVMSIDTKPSEPWRPKPVNFPPPIPPSLTGYPILKHARTLLLHACNPL